MLEGVWTSVARNDGRVVKQIKQPAAVARQNYLLFCTLYNGGGVDVVGFLELLPSLEK